MTLTRWLGVAAAAATALALAGCSPTPAPSPSPTGADRVPEWDPPAGTELGVGVDEAVDQFSGLFADARTAASEVNGQELTWQGLLQEVSLLPTASGEVCALYLSDTNKEFIEGGFDVDADVFLATYAATLEGHDLPAPEQVFKDAGGGNVVVSDRDGIRFRATNATRATLTLLAPLPDELCESADS
ncbi:hypothetical protein GCM10028820_05780 [Tessaracoccus terricola]